MKVLATLLASAAAFTACVRAAPTLAAAPFPSDFENDLNSTLYERGLDKRAWDGVFRKCSRSGTFALTFDDGPYYLGQEIANYLNQQGVKGSFFVKSDGSGNNWGCIYDRADDLLARYRAGHMIGSHTWSHPDVSKLSADQLNRQLDYVEEALRKILGIKPRWFRPPFGSVSQENVRVLQRRGYGIVNWDVDSGDTAGLSTSQSIQRYNNILNSYPEGHIALNHETKQNTVQVIRDVVPKLKSRGWRLVSVAECTGHSPYQSVGTPGRRDSSWTCNGKPGPVAFASPIAGGPLPAPTLDFESDLNSTLYERGLDKRAWDGVFTKCSKSGTFALTFDDGPYTPGNKIASYLSSKGAKGTFFVNGNNYDCKFSMIRIYDRADDLIARYKAGHQIGSHTWSHADITKISAQQLNQELTLVEEALRKILGIKPRWFRPPYGSYNAATVKILQSRGYGIVNWDIDTGDSLGQSTSYSIKQYDNILNTYPTGHVALNHETYTGTANTVIPNVVPKLQAKGWKLVTVAECLGHTPYQSVTTPGKRDSTWTCSGKPGAAADRAARVRAPSRA
ncbi:hypothetical protein OIO90_003861 [Microbotryomycetes sp. JL221]|nr:hypothetical protein OIO90_003861 [Microbotryomycetes sp. JL221]